MSIFGSFGHCLPNILHTWPHDSFQMIQLSMTLGIFQGHGTLSHQISFDDLEVHLKAIQPRLSFLRPFKLSLACFRVARSPSNSWASCFMMLSSFTLKHCQSSPGSCDECRHSARWLPTFGPSQSTWDISPPVSCYIAHCIHHRHLSHSARKLILILPSHGE